MNAFKRISRPSLFARMSLLFGLLVTAPLVISGIVLSLVGWQIVNQSGDQLADIGSGAVERTAGKFSDIATDTLDQAANQVAEAGQRQIEQTSERAVEVSRNRFASGAQEMAAAGKKAVDDASGSMVRVSETKLDSSLNSLRKLNAESQARLRDAFVQGMQSELDRSGDPIREDLTRSFTSAWDVSALRRASSVVDTSANDISQIVQSMQVPLRRVDVVRITDKAGETLKRELTNNRTNLLRVMLVDSAGVERVRLIDMTTDTEEVDWANPMTPEGRTREALRKATRPYIEEPIRQDPATKEWFIRIAHRVIEESPDPATTDQGTREPGYSAFVVADYRLQPLVGDALLDSAPELQAFVMDAATGTILSSRDHAQVNQVTRVVADALQNALKGTENPNAQPTFEYARGETVFRARGVAYPNNPGVWVVTTQSAEQILQPVNEYQAKIRASWATSLNSVKKLGDSVIEQRNQNAARDKERLLRDASAQIRKEVVRQQAKVGTQLDGVRSRLVDAVKTGLEQETTNLQREAAQAMNRAAQELAYAATGQVEDGAKKVALEARSEIQQQATQAAKGAAQKMLLNSTWLIPLFLVLALFLATLTARSLVRPINQLVRGTQALAQGDYDQRIPVQGDDELARLAQAFNHMAQAIQQGQEELRQSHDHLAWEKARIQGIVDSSPDGLVMLDPSGRIAFINPTACAFLNLRPAELPVAAFLPEDLPEPGSTRLREILDRAGAGQEGVQEWEGTEPQRRVLQVREVQLRSSDLASGRTYGSLIHLHDITRERVVDEMKTDFISLVSHELRTPLTSILGFSSYMLTGRMGEVGETQKTALESIHRQAKRLSAIISDFLDVSRIESGKIDMKQEPVPVLQVAGRVLADLRPQAEEKRLRVFAESPDGEQDLVAVGDEQRIAQVFTNLVGNALKFTDEGGVSVNLTRQNGHIHCLVRDTGCGIPPDELERVFDRFYQVEKVVTRKTGGTGLGLAIVKNIVEAHGGRIWIESQVGRGTEVHFTLPSAGDER